MLMEEIGKTVGLEIRMARPLVNQKVHLASSCISQFLRVLCVLTWI
jgi:hypothetical protein